MEICWVSLDCNKNMPYNVIFVVLYALFCYN